MHLAVIKLLDHKGFFIYGPAILETSVEPWDRLRVLGAEQTVRESIAYLGLGDHDVVPTSRRDTHQDVLARSNNDLAMLKLVLARQPVIQARTSNQGLWEEVRILTTTTG